MALLSDYTSGTVSSDGDVITGTGTAWLTAGFREGDTFLAPGWVVKVLSVDSETQLTVDTTRGLVGDVLDDDSYGLTYASDGSRVSAQARQLIDMLGGSGNLQAFAALVGSAGLIPVFTGAGTMEVRPYAAGLVPRGVWNDTTEYAIGEVVIHGDYVYTSVVNGNVGNEPPEDDTSDEYWMYVPVAPGPEGPQGPAGNDGPANSLSIGTVTGGDEASATITGTAPTQTLNLVLPKGDKGDAGSEGWTPVFAVVADGARYVQQVVDWVGGTGTKPDVDVYVGEDGFVEDIGDAVNIRGASGAGTGDVVGPSSSTDGRMALFDGATGKLLKEGAAPFSGAYADLSGKPTLGTAAATDATAYATASQGVLADSAVQPSDLADVATSGDYDDLANKPTLGTMAAEAASDYAKVADLGDAATLDVGTTSGTVAAGDDSRIAGALQSADVASFAQFNATTADKVLKTDSVWSDLGVLTDASTIAISFNNGYDFGGASNAPLAIAGNRTLGAPQNVRNGKKGVLWFTASGATRTLTLHANWILAAGVEAGPYSITTSQTIGIAYVSRGTTVIVTGIIRIG